MKRCIPAEHELPWNPDHSRGRFWSPARCQHRGHCCNRDRQLAACRPP